MDTYLRHPITRAVIIFGIVFFVGSLLFIAVESFGFDDFLFHRDYPASINQADEHPTLFTNFPYIDQVNHRIWFFQKLDTASGTAQGVEILFRDTQGHDEKKYFAREAYWNGHFWKLGHAMEIVYGPTDTTQNYETLDLPDLTTPPSTFVAPRN